MNCRLIIFILNQLDNPSPLRPIDLVNFNIKKTCCCPSIISNAIYFLWFTFFHKILLLIWKQSNKKLGKFWHCWFQNYLLALREKAKKLKTLVNKGLPSSRKGVLIVEPEISCNKWKMSIIGPNQKIIQKTRNWLLKCLTLGECLCHRVASNSWQNNTLN